MIKQKIVNLVEKFKEASPTVQGMIVLIIILVIGIIIRWRSIIEEMLRGFDFYSGK